MNRTHNYKVYVASEKEVYNVVELQFRENGIHQVSGLQKGDVYIGSVGYVDGEEIILLQGTGKKDIHGNEIFEGMLVSAGGIEMMVVWDDVDLSFKRKYGGGYYKMCECEITGWSFFDSAH